MMKGKAVLIFLLIFAFALGSISCGNTGVGDPDEVAVIETNYGRIVIEFFPNDAPRHVANFKKLTREKFYDGTKFFRLVKNRTEAVAVQGGDPNTINGDPSTWGKGQPGQETVPAEFSKTLKHVRGIVSAARKGDDPDSATSQFFICAAAYPAWDGQYSIFGRVIDGMNVVDSIVAAPVWPKTDRPLDPVVVNRIYLVKRDEISREQE
ncbi:MAG TPA: peptidylprolyl isomerase [Blastocatellia bacterium]|nr:peptidylprolyl isomerase [Blastocatellia bacterium]